ncbi:protein arginine kinase [Priestia megaterium]|nr:protein arginine kinase [Priestia megaterium]
MPQQLFFTKPVSSWMSQEAPDSDIVLSSRIRLARNLTNYLFPTLFSQQQAVEVVKQFEKVFQTVGKENKRYLHLLKMNELKSLEKRVLVEKHLISPNLAEAENEAACFLSEQEDFSIMINEEDHLRIQCLFPGLQLSEALNSANEVDNWIEKQVDYAFEENRGYLTSCPTNVGTGLRASVMMHLPALVITRQIHRIIPAINQLGLVVRGIYGEGSEALGNIFQVSNQMTLGKSEEDIVADLNSVVRQLITQERSARDALFKTSHIELENRVYRSYGTLAHSRIIESKEASQCLSDVRLGIDLGYIPNLSKNILNELIIMIQPGFLQQYSGEILKPDERDIKRATLIRDRLNISKNID